MSGPPIISRRDRAALESALHDDQVVVIPSGRGYRLAALLHRPLGLTAWRTLLPAYARDAEPLVTVGHVDQAKELVSDWTEEIRRLTDRLWPGPALFDFSSPDPPTLSGAPEVSVRIGMADNRALRRILRASGPLATADLRDGTGEPITSAEAAAAVCSPDDVALIFDGGPSAGLIETVIDCQRTPPVVRDEGALPAVYVEAALLMGARRRSLFMPSGALRPRPRPRA